MAQLRNTIRISASPEAVWKVLGDPLATPLWVPGLTSAKMDGNVRVCTAMDGNEIVEEVDYSNERRRFRYTQLKVALPVKNSRGTMAVQKEGNGSLVVWDAEFEVPDPSQESALSQMIDGYYKQTLESLRQRIESP